MISRFHAHTAALSLFFAPVAATSGEAPTASAPEAKAGEGVLCLWALVSVASEVGKRCPGRSDSAFQATLDGSVARIDRYVAASGRAEPEDILRFKEKQGGVGETIDTLCSADKLGLYDGFHAQGAAPLTQAVDRLVAHPGPPTWGDCL